MFNFERAVIKRILYSYTNWQQLPTETSIYEWDCHFYVASKTNITETDLSLRTDTSNINVIIDKVVDVKKWDSVELFDTVGNKYWDYQIQVVNKEKSISWITSNTNFTCKPIDGERV